MRDFEYYLLEAEFQEDLDYLQAEIENRSEDYDSKTDNHHKWVIKQEFNKLLDMIENLRTNSERRIKNVK